MVGFSDAPLPRGEINFSACIDARTLRNRKMKSAFALAVAIVGAALVGVSSEGARAANIFQFLFGGFRTPAPVAAPLPLAYDNSHGFDAPHRHSWHRQKIVALTVTPARQRSAPAAEQDSAEPAKTAAAPASKVCVRLCDGYFFPVDSAATASSCDALCPDAPVGLYRRPAGSDKIEQAISDTGAPYSRLPVAFRHQGTLDNTCSCHRDGVQAFSLRQDATLRKGDAVMTANGFEVFGGANQMPHQQRQFNTLAKAGLSHNKFVLLRAMERVTLPDLRPQRSAAWLIDPPKRTAAIENENQKIRLVEAPVIATQ